MSKVGVLTRVRIYLGMSTKPLRFIIFFMERFLTKTYMSRRFYCDYLLGSEVVFIDKTSAMEKAVVNATVGLYPLIVVDMMNGCCSEKFERPEINITFNRIRQMIPRLVEFADEYRRLGGKIIWVRSTPWREEYLPKNINRLYRENPNATFYIEHDVEESVEFYDGISPRRLDEIFAKNTYSAFADAGLQKLFREHRWDTYLLSGVFAEACVNATLIDGFTKGLFTIILSDLVESMDDEDQQAHKRHLLTHQWPFMYGHVMTSSEFLKKLAKRSPTTLHKKGSCHKQIEVRNTIPGYQIGRLRKRN